MCGHADSAEKMIRTIVQDLYPAIEAQFLALDTDTDNVHFYVAMNTLKSEFFLLAAYENRLVFPSILKVFNSKQLSELPELPNINELLQLTRHKEQRLMQFVHTFSKEYMKTGVKNQVAEKLIRLFDEDFLKTKSRWNGMVSGWIKECEYFQQTISSPLNTN